MVKVCLVGCGAIARLHLSALQALKAASSVTVVGLVDPNRKAAISLSKQLPEQCQVV